MIAQAADLIAHFRTHIVGKRRIHPRMAAQANLNSSQTRMPISSARIEKRILFVIAAAPGPKHVHVHRRRIGDVPAEFLLRDPERKHISRNPVGAFAVNLPPLTASRTDGPRFSAEAQSPQADRLLFPIQQRPRRVFISIVTS